MGSNVAPPEPPAGCTHGFGWLGIQLWDVLTARGYRPAPPGAGEDGFEVFVPTDTGLDVVLICPRYEGMLRGLATRGVRRGWIGRYARAAEAAGFHAELVEIDGAPLGVMAARDRPTALRAAADAVTGYERGR